MNKWLARLLGLIILLVCGMFFFDTWFNPPVPPTLAPDTAATGEIAPSPATNTAPPPTPNPSTEQPSISLTSLQDMESDNGAPPPVLSNPQGNPDAQPKTSAPIAPPPPPSPAEKPRTASSNQKPAITLTSLEDKQDSTPVAPTPKAASNAPTNTPAPKPAPAPKPSPEPKTANTSNNAPAWIQAGSFGERDNAEQLASSLRKNGMKTQIESATVNGRKYNRVYVGPLPANQVDATLQKLSRMGVNARQVNR